MKQNKIIGILATVLFVLLGLILLRDYLPKNDSDGQSYTQHWNGYSSDAVEAVVIRKGTDELHINREGNEWKAGEVVLDKSMVDEFVTHLLKPTTQELVATTNARHEALGLSDSATSSALIKTSDKEQTVRFGSLASTGR